jgi:hypothetical protein
MSFFCEDAFSRGPSFSHTSYMALKCLSDWAPLIPFKMNVSVACFDGNLWELGAFLQTWEIQATKRVIFKIIWIERVNDGVLSDEYDCPRTNCMRKVLPQLCPSICQWVNYRSKNLDPNSALVFGSQAYSVSISLPKLELIISHFFWVSLCVLVSVYTQS